MNFYFAFLLLIALSISMISLENSFAQNMSPHHQWKNTADPDTITCKSGHLLLQKNDGTPTCVMPSTYLKLIDRGYGNYDSSIMSNRPEMMNQLMQNMVSNEKLMHHWHEMMQKNPIIMMNTMNDWVSQMKVNPELMKNILGPMASDPQLREKMIQAMKKHSNMENSLKMHSKWMDSVHHPMMKSGMHGSSCLWCPNYQINSISPSIGFSNSDRMMGIMHEFWVNSGMSYDMHQLMIQNPSHMSKMSEQMMNPILDSIMDDEDLRQQMIELLLEHPEFMNSIRHSDSETNTDN
ncbi:hypothetical protein [Nitrosopumilus sp. b3]|uniref:hypothetical protein n=1 Tax=Nitrosopumilus sp. b3 TaxID=2109909 RepID=UPI002106EE41|nr:hypothetical protein [Nitrosopumilus sp. b3]